MGSTKIRPFQGLRNGREDPVEYIEDLEWLYDQHYKTNETDPDKTRRLLFRQNLEGMAYDWYIDLEKETKNNWNQLRSAFLKAFEVTEKDEQAKKFELRIRVAQLKQEDEENIADYLKRAAELASKMVNDDIDVGMAILRGMKDQFKREQINFECNKGSDYSYPTVEKLIKAAYSEVGKPNPFDPSNKDVTGVVLPHGRPVQTNDDLLRQVLINTNQAFPALLQGFRAINMAVSNNAGFNAPQQGSYQPQPKKDLSKIQCFICKQYGHYASFHNQSSSQTPPLTITANSAIPYTYSGTMPDSQHHNQHHQHEGWHHIGQNPNNSEGSSDARNYYPSPVHCLLPLDSNFSTQAMAAQRTTRAAAKQGKPLQQAAGIKKQTKQKAVPKTSKAGLEHMVDLEEKENQPQDDAEEMNLSEEELGFEEVESQFTFQETQPEREPKQNNKQPMNQSHAAHPPPTRVSKTGKVQELVPVKAPKVLDPIRGLLGGARFSIEEILKLPLTMEVGQFLDKSDIARQELALNMQRSRPRYRVKKTPKSENQADPGRSNMVMTAAVQKEPPAVVAHAFDDDGQSQPFMITAWIGTVKLPRTLIDGGSLVELVSRAKLLAMTPPPRVHTDGYLRVSLATDAIHTLTNYVYLPVNVQGIQAVVKAWVVDNQVYDLLLGVPWIRRVGLNPDYGTGKVTIRGNDSVPRQVLAEIIPMHVNLPTVELDEDEAGGDAADKACQILLDEQENYQS